MDEQALIPISQQELERARFMPVMNMTQAVERREIIVQAMQKLMKQDQDYGKIPGTLKPTLLQPGADKLNNLFGLVPHFETITEVLDWTGENHGGEPFFYYRTKCHLMRGDHAMGEGEGSCNSWESRYRWRKTERVCPQCGKETIIKGKAEYGGGWLCFAKKGGCGAKFRAGDPAIEQQAVGQKPNPDVFDLVNTILKIANKRAKIAACLNATSAHEFFTQDVEDMPHPTSETEPHREEPPQQEVPNRVVIPQAKPEVKQSEAAAPALAALWLRMKDYASTVETIGFFKEDIERLTGSDKEYYSILAHNGMAHANEIKGRRKGDVRAVVKELWEFCEMTAARLSQESVATDDDLPPPFGVKQPEKDPDYAD